MTDERIVAIEAAHQPYEDEGQPLCPKCIHFEPHEYDSTPDDWPCDTAIVLARLHATVDQWDTLFRTCEAQRNDALRRLREVEQERELPEGWGWVALGPQDARMKVALDAARADADRLAEALRVMIAETPAFGVLIEHDDIRAALAAHEENE